MTSPAAARRSRRFTVTMPERLFDWIHERAAEEGRSASNLAAYLLEKAMTSEKAKKAR